MRRIALKLYNSNVRFQHHNCTSMTQLGNAVIVFVEYLPEDGRKMWEAHYMTVYFCIYHFAVIGVRCQRL